MLIPASSASVTRCSNPNPNPHPHPNPYPHPPPPPHQVSDEMLRDALRISLGEMKQLVEPAGAIALA
eukprot:scaffold3315_cov62-Phaeocystis_antarctica.AAC.7